MKTKNISFEPTSKQLTANSGLVFLLQLWESLKFDKELDQALPISKRQSVCSMSDKFKSVVIGQCLGAENLEDFLDMGQERLFREVCQVISPRSLGNYLRRFCWENIHQLESILIDQAMKLRQMIFPDERDFILSMDSSDHRQYGQKMEGVTYGYKKQLCLNSQNCFDQHGFAYGFELRPGNTYSSVGSELWVHRIFSRVPESMCRYFRADSAYAKKAMYNALISAEVKFAMPIRANILRGLLRYNQHTINWKKTRMMFFDSKDCEVAEGIYPLKNLAGGHDHLRVVFLRAPREKKEGEDVHSEDPYLYYCLVTNMGSEESSIEQVIRFYRGRANCENFIKDQKMNFDFYHFPCQKLDANRAYGLMGTFGYNLMRTLSFFISKAGCFAKRVRQKLIKIPAIICKHARKLKLRMNRHYLEVVNQTMKKLKLITSGDRMFGRAKE